MLQLQWDTAESDASDEQPRPYSRMMAPTAELCRFAFGVSVCIFTLVYFANSWVGDDAYITFRTIDNFINGLGLRWNTIERVQTYTSPLWLLLCSIPYSITHEVFFTAIGFSYVIWLVTFTVATMWFERLTTNWNAVVFVGLLLTSKSVMDYSSSGLEHCLSALWAVIFVMALRWAELDDRRPVWPAFLAAGFAYITRQDTLLLYAPACVVLLMYRPVRQRVWRQLLMGSLPALAWTAFSIFYYGFIFPNTAYAKALVDGVPVASRAKQGVAYMLTTALWDPFSIAILLVFAYAMIRRRSLVAIALVSGVAMYVFYIVFVAASSSTMGLRFVSVLVVVAAAATLSSVSNREAFVVAAVGGIFMFTAPLAPIRTIGCTWSTLEQPGWANSAILDMRAHSCKDGAALANFQRNDALPRHVWYRMGMEFRASAERVRWGGPEGLPAMGYFGYASGSHKIIVDPYGVTDPLIARLPATVDKLWLPGEIPRPAPAGYLESLRTGANVIADPDLRQYYDSLRTITAGPLLSLRRWKEIAALNFGLRNDLVRRYEAKRRRRD